MMAAMPTPADQPSSTKESKMDEKLLELVCVSSSGPPSSGPPPGLDMAKMMCNNIIYSILANDDPKEYPLAEDGPMANPISTYSSNDGACTFDATMEVCQSSGGAGETCTKSKVSMTQANCDCSDPEKYNFEDKGRFKI